MSPTKLLIPLIVGAFFLAYAASLPLALWNDPTAIVTRADQINFFILVGGFGLALAASVVHVLRALQQYLQALHDLAPEDANDLATQLSSAVRHWLVRRSCGCNPGAWTWTGLLSSTRSADRQG